MIGKVRCLHHVQHLVKKQKYIYLNTFPSANAETNAYMLEHKDTLINRKIRNFSEKNWYEWGAPRNISAMEKHKGEPCIYLYNLTRQSKVGFIDNVQYFGGALLLLIPKKKRTWIWSGRWIT